MPPVVIETVTERLITTVLSLKFHTTGYLQGMVVMMLTYRVVIRLFDNGEDFAHRYREGGP